MGAYANLCNDNPQREGLLRVLSGFVVFSWLTVSSSWAFGFPKGFYSDLVME